MKNISLIILLLSFSAVVNSQSKDNLIAINQTWDKFYKAFENLDHSLMAEIHSKDLVRISGGRNILNYETYINNYKARFQQNKESGITYNISLRFFERINTNETASERGVYQLTVNKGQPSEQNYYGQFHVIFKKINDKWLITMDYDSSEGNTINKDNYLKASAIDDFNNFVKQ